MLTSAGQMGIHPSRNSRKLCKWRSRAALQKHLQLPDAGPLPAEGMQGCAFMLPNAEKGPVQAVLHAAFCQRPARGLGVSFFLELSCSLLTLDGQKQLRMQVIGASSNRFFESSKAVQPIPFALTIIVWTGSTRVHMPWPATRLSGII